MGGMDWPGEGFALPVATAVGEGDVVYVLSRGMEGTGYGDPLAPRAFGVRVGKFHLPPEPGGEEHLTTFGAYGSGAGQFVWPAGIALDGDGNVYVTDEWSNRVLVYDGDGQPLRRWGTSGAGPGQLDRPSGIAIDSHDNVYVVDSLNHRVQRLTPDGGYGSEWGGFGDAPGMFDSPWGAAVDAAGTRLRRRPQERPRPALLPGGRIRSPVRRLRNGRGTASPAVGRGRRPGRRRLCRGLGQQPGAGVRRIRGVPDDHLRRRPRAVGVGQADRRRQSRHPEGPPQGEPGAGAAVRAADRRHLRRDHARG